MAVVGWVLRIGSGRPVVTVVEAGQAVDALDRPRHSSQAGLAVMGFGKSFRGGGGLGCGGARRGVADHMGAISTEDGHLVPTDPSWPGTAARD
jgi:hypothetical protein